jgi:hypothetical protein
MEIRMSNATEPAHPCTRTSFGEMSDYNGLSKLEHAAILLRVPQSGDEQIDAMTREANRRDIAAMAVSSVISNVAYELTDQQVARTSAQVAGSLTDQLEKP